MLHPVPGWAAMLASLAMLQTIVAPAGSAAAREDGRANGTVAGSGGQPARDGNVAIREELDSARRAGSVAAYDLFIARHPDHPLARIARRERARLIGRGAPATPGRPERDDR